MEKKFYVVKLMHAGDNKIALLKNIRNITNFELRAAKNIIDVVPSVICVRETQQEAQEIKLFLHDLGASVEISEVDEAERNAIVEMLSRYVITSNPAETNRSCFLTTLTIIVLGLAIIASLVSMFK